MCIYVQTWEKVDEKKELGAATGLGGVLKWKRGHLVDQ
jgi:hypothetical protein